VTRLSGHVVGLDIVEGRLAAAVGHRLGVNRDVRDLIAGQHPMSWTHFQELLPIDDPLKREFYAELCRAERWSTRTLRHKIGHLLFERTAVSKQPDELIARDIAALRDEDQVPPDLVFRDPYFLDFLGLTGAYLEKDVQQAILRELEAFILELGSDFAFVARQKRISVDNFGMRNSE
jgi:predicted nuclease of restriction endonuclease-like (RecB) superfamily